MSADPILFSEKSTHDGHVLAFVRLNRPKALNAQTIEMVEALTEKLAHWDSRDEVVCVIIDGEGERAFCAGADIVGLYHHMKACGGGACPPAERFFIVEYALDYLIRNYAKPVVCWGSGVVMGGGLGLLASASHRVVTETTKAAMPEVTIGLYPDVAAGWFFNKMPGRVGQFLALTGSHINATDAWLCGLADQFIGSDQREAVYQALTEVKWQGQQREDGASIAQCLREFEAKAPERPQSLVLAHQSAIAQMTDTASPVEFFATLKELKGQSEWLERAYAVMASGSPTSIALTFEQWLGGRYLSLADSFKREMVMTLHCVRNPDFAEGVRALLVDKDKNPRWSPARLEDVDPEKIKSYFQLPEDYTKNPLAWLE